MQNILKRIFFLFSLSFFISSFHLGAFSQNHTTTIDNRDVTGSLTCLSKYKKGSTQTMQFQLILSTNDLEFADSVALVFPTGITPTIGSNPFSATTQGQPTEALNPIQNNTICWGNNDNTFGGIEPGTHVFNVTVTTDASLSGTQYIQYFVSGDQFHGTVHSFSGILSIEPYPSKDIAADLLTSPQSSCSLGLSESIEFSAKNNGLDTITQFSATLFIDGVLEETTSFTALSLKPDSFSSFSFSSGFDLSVKKDYQIVIALNLTDDEYNANDTLKKIISSGVSLNYPYKLDFENPESDFSNWTNYLNKWALWKGNSHSGQHMLAYLLSETVSSNLLFSRCFNLEGGQSYDLSFWNNTYQVNNSDSVNIFVMIGNAPDEVSMNDTLLFEYNICHNDYVKKKVIFTPVVSGIYYIGFRISGKGNPPQTKLICMDDFQLKKAYDNDLELADLFLYSSLPVNSNQYLPRPIAAIYNAGINSVNTTVSYSATGLLNYNENRNITLSSDSTMQIEFHSMIQSGDTGQLVCTVNVGNDDYNDNNSLSKTLQISTERWSCIHSNSLFHQAGFGDTTGILYVKYPTSGITRIKGLQFQINDTNSIGQPVWGVVADTLGNIMGQSGTMNIPYGSLGSVYYIPFPEPVMVSDSFFLAGIGQDIGSYPFFPVATESNDFVPEGIFFQSQMDGTNLQSIKNMGILSIDAFRENRTPDVLVSRITEPNAACSFSTNETLSIIIKNLGELAVMQGEKLILQTYSNQFLPITDTLLLSQNFFPGDSISYSFSTTFDMSQIISDTFHISVVYAAESNNTNNTFDYIIERLPYPSHPSLPDSIYACNGDTVTLNAIAEPDAIYQWYYGNTPLPGNNSELILTYAIDPQGLYILYKSNPAGCQIIDSVYFTNKEIPSAAISFPSFYCLNEAGSIELSATVSFQDSVHWEATGDGILSNPYETETVYWLGNHDSISQEMTFLFTVYNVCQTLNDTISVEIKTLPVPVISSDSEICQGDSLFLCATGGDNCLWFPGNYVSNPYEECSWASPYQTTTFYAMLTNDCGFITDSVSVFVTEPPIGLITPDTFVCSGSTFQLLASGGSSYVWAPSSLLDNSSIANPIATITQSVIFSVTVSNICFDVVDDILVEAGNTLPMDFLGSDIVVCAENSVILDAGFSNSTYLWSDSTTEQILTVDTNGIGIGTFLYWVEVNNFSGCSGRDSINITFEICQNTNPVGFETISFSLFPNPVVKELSIVTKEIANQIRLYDIHGKTIIAIEPSSVNATFNLKHLSEGVYVVGVVMHDGMEIRKRVVKQ